MAKTTTSTCHLSKSCSECKGSHEVSHVVLDYSIATFTWLAAAVPSVYADCRVCCQLPNQISLANAWCGCAKPSFRPSDCLVFFCKLITLEACSDIRYFINRYKELMPCKHTTRFLLQWLQCPEDYFIGCKHRKSPINCQTENDHTQKSTRVVEHNRL
jgi:hypothetical protein